MVEHDAHVGELLKLLDELGIANDTIVHLLDRQRPALQHLARRRHHALPQREELELGGRLPRAGVRPLARASSRRARRSTASSPTRTGCRPSPPPPATTNIKEKLLKGDRAQRPELPQLPRRLQPARLPARGKAKESPRNEFFYVNDDGQIVAMRYQDWKVVFLENRGEAFGVWREPFIELRVPLLFNLRRDPFEKAQHNVEHLQRLVPRPAVRGRADPGWRAKFLLTMKEYPPSQTPGSFNLEKIEKQIEAGAGGR